MLRCLYLFNPRVVCINCGISDKNAESEIIEAGDWPLIPEIEDLRHSNLNQSQDQKRISRIKLLTFQEATKRVNLPRVIDLLSIDVEGHELDVLRSIPFEHHHFRLIITGMHLLDGKGECIWKHRDFDAIDELLAKYGNLQLNRTGPNAFCHSKA